MGKFSVRHGDFVFHCDHVADAAAYTADVRREFNETPSTGSLVEQAKVLGVVEKYFGPNKGISLVKEVLRDAGYGELATQVAQLHGRRSRAAHPHVQVAQRLENALADIGRLDTTHIVAPPFDPEHKKRLIPQCLCLDKLVSCEDSGSQSLVEAQNATIMQLMAQNRLLQQSLDEASNTKHATIITDSTDGLIPTSHNSSQTQAVVVCPRIVGCDVSTQCVAKLTCDASTFMNDAQLLVDAGTQYCTQTRHGKIPGKGVQTEFVYHERASQTTTLRRKAQHTQVEFDRQSVAAQTLAVEVSSRGCRAHSEVEDKSVFTDRGLTSIDAVWLGRAASEAAVRDVSAKFANISQHIFVSRITELILLVIFIASDWHERIAEAALGVSRLVQWCPIDKLRVLHAGFPEWAWTSQSIPSQQDDYRIEQMVNLCSRLPCTSLPRQLLWRWRSYTLNTKRMKRYLGNPRLELARKKLSVACFFYRWKLRWMSWGWRKIPDTISEWTDTGLDWIPPPPPPPPL